MKTVQKDETEEESEDKNESPPKRDNPEEGHQEENKRLCVLLAASVWDVLITL